ncbi:phosphatase PAP2 family protein [Trichloromonas sp.]|uniref:phosphatase PAP2 family protein n=1 Tax=Trichloromonas sp. TaxID=3069249 RepID=UPI003D81B818
MSKGENLKFWLRHALLPFALFVLLAGLFELTDWDLRLSAPFFDPMLQFWPYKHSWWAGGLIHTGGKYLVLLCGAGALAAWGGSFACKRLRFWRRTALFLCLSIGLGTGLVSLGKQMTNRHCPWDCDLYGGDVPYVRLFEAPPAGCKQGKCFPAGHAAGGFSLMSLYFALYRRRRLALVGLASGFGLGALFGFGQVARGAHFVSHNIWTAAICWTVALLLYAFMLRTRPMPAAEANR